MIFHIAIFNLRFFKSSAARNVGWCRSGLSDDGALQPTALARRLDATDNSSDFEFCKTVASNAEKDDCNDKDYGHVGSDTEMRAVDEQRSHAVDPVG